MNDISRTVSTPWIALALNVTGRIGALLPFLGWWMPKFPMIVAMLVGCLVALVSIARLIALKSGQRIDGNHEFIGQHQPQPKENLAS